ncbi:hypothetical protein D3C87_1760380 [compost metagenome]
MDAQRLRRHRAHYRKLQQMLGAAIDIGAQIKQLAITLLRRDSRHHCRPIDTGQRLQHES